MIAARGSATGQFSEQHHIHERIGNPFLHKPGRVAGTVFHGVPLSGKKSDRFRTNIQSNGLFPETEGYRIKFLANDFP